MSILPEVTAPERKVSHLHCPLHVIVESTLTSLGHVPAQGSMDGYNPPHLPRLLSGPTLWYHVV